MDAVRERRDDAAPQIELAVGQLRPPLQAEHMAHVEFFQESVFYEKFGAAAAFAGRLEEKDNFVLEFVSVQGEYLGGKGYLWSIAERARLERYFAELAKQLARYYIGLASYIKAEQILLRSIGYQPYDEDAYEQLLKVCSLQGDRHSVTKYYEGIQSSLQSELGIEPRPSLKRLYENIMNNF